MTTLTDGSLVPRPSHPSICRLSLGMRLDRWYVTVLLITHHFCTDTHYIALHTPITLITLHNRLSVASYPGLLTPMFVACSTNMGEGLVKLSHMVWGTWMCGGVAHPFCTTVKRLSESKKRCYDCLMSSTQSFYGLCLRSVVHSLTCCFPGYVPLLHTSRYVIPRDSVLPGLPPR